MSYKSEPVNQFELNNHIIIITKNGQFQRCIQYAQTSVAAIQEAVKNYRKQFLIEDGYKITWQ